MDEDDKTFWEKWRSSKWDSHVGTFSDEDIYSRDKQEAAVHLIRKFVASLSASELAEFDILKGKNHADTLHNEEMSKFHTVSRITLIIQLLMNDLLKNLHKEDFMRIFNVAATCFDLDAAAIFSSKRSTLTHLLTMSAPLMMTEFDRLAFDCCAIIEPRSIAIDLASAMSALGSGEVQEIVRPEPSKKQGESWSWDQERLKACQHVFFLKGKGLTKKKAQSRVSEATGIGVETLRTYETNIKKQDHDVHLLDAAKIAGDYMQRFEADAGLNLSSVLDGLAMIVLHQILNEPLSAFGVRYRRLHGARHNQVSGESV